MNDSIQMYFYSFCGLLFRYNISVIDHPLGRFGKILPSAMKSGKILPHRIFCQIPLVLSLQMISISSDLLSCYNRKFRRFPFSSFSYLVHKKKFLINTFVTGLLGGLVAITGEL